VGLFSSACKSAGEPLSSAELDRIGWEQSENFQYYLSSKIRLTKLPGDFDSVDVEFTSAGAAKIRDSANARYTVDLSTGLAGRLVRYNKQKQFLYIAFEEGDETLVFGKDALGQFSLMYTVDEYYENGTPYVEYDGVRYSVTGDKPHLNVVIKKTEDTLRRQMQGSTVSQQKGTQKIDDAVKAAASVLIDDLPKGCRAAVVNISGPDYDEALFIRDELEYQLAAARKFVLVERSKLDAIRTEQNFQLSGDVSDASAVSIGNLSGADIVITGAVTGSGATRRLTIKALNVETGQIAVQARESF
jgi:hypothetical protein